VSRSKVSEQQGDDEGFDQALNAHRDMLLRGRSFSGRERNVAYLNLAAQEPNANAGGKKNLGGERTETQFANVSGAIGIDYPDDGRGLVKVDWDGDGDLDFWISNRSAPRLRFLRNDIPEKQQSISLRLLGNGISSNRDAVGARVELVPEKKSSSSQVQETDLPKLVQSVRGGEGFLSQSTRWLVFGLGESAEPQRALVRWPDGMQEAFDKLVPGSRYTLVQGSGQPKEIEVRQPPTGLRAAPLEVPPPSGTVRIPLLTLLPLPKIEFEAEDGSPQSLPKGEPLLVNLWATWCAPCRGELLEMAERKEEFNQQGLKVLALCMDSISSEPTQEGAADQFLDQIQFPFARGQATEELAELFQSLHDLLVVNDRPLPAPTSFLIDRQGRLAAIYKGRVNLDQVFADSQHSSLSQAERFANSATMPGKLLENEKLNADLEALQLTNLLKAADSFKQSGKRKDAKAQLYAGIAVEDKVEFRNNLASLLMDEGRFSEAELHLNKAMELDPNVPDVLNNLGNLRTYQRRDDEALKHYRSALAIDPDFALARHNMASSLASKGQNVRAIEECERVLATDSKLFQSHHLLANLLRDSGALERALKHYAWADQFGPPQPRVHNDWGIALMRFNQPTEAIAQFEKAVEIAPEFPEAQTNLRRAKSSVSRNKEK
jgi:tetratricopeptide (TPR) repeat protein